MTKYEFSCRDCTNTLISANGTQYCRPAIEDDKSPVLHGWTKEEFRLTCEYYTTEPRTPGIYELVKAVALALDHCPACGGEAAFVYGGPILYVQCGTCGLKSESRPTEHQTKEAWNGGHYAA